MIPAAGNAADACFQLIDLLFALTVPFANLISSRLALSSRDATLSAKSNLALIAASFTEGESEAAVTEPPDATAAPSFELPICSTTSLIWRR